MNLIKQWWLFAVAALIMLVMSDYLRASHQMLAVAAIGLSLACAMWSVIVFGHRVKQWVAED